MSEDHDHDHEEMSSDDTVTQPQTGKTAIIAEDDTGWKSHWKLLLAILILFVMLALEYGYDYIPEFPFNLVIYLAAYLLAGMNVLNLAFRKAIRFDFFNEFFLMSVATIGAFAIGSYSEGVAVMAFY